MVYVGSKNRIAKDIVPIIQNYVTDKYLEPFVGGANIIDKIVCPLKKGADKNKYLIALLDYISKGGKINQKSILLDEYINVRDNKHMYEDWYVGLVGFCATYGARFFEGYARDKKGVRDIPKERIDNIQKQAKNLTDISFSIKDYRDIDVCGFTIYCDPPYTTKKIYFGEKFNHNEFHDWCRKMSKNNTVLVSGYESPFKEIWRGKLRCSLANDKINNTDRTEKLYLV